MDNTITVALVTGLCAAIPSVIATYLTNRKSQAIFKYRLDLLEEKQNKHNSVIERTYRLENRVSIHDEQLKVANHRIEDLEK